MSAGVFDFRQAENARLDESLVDLESLLLSRELGYSGVALIMTVNLEGFGYPDADRGYRYAMMDAGMLGGRLYLQTVGLGLGCTGIGAFFDDEVSEQINVDPDKELVIYMAAIGVTAEGTER